MGAVNCRLDAGSVKVRKIRLLCYDALPRHPVRHIVLLNREFCSDLQWWSLLLPIILPQPHPAHSDASSSQGYGALNDSSEWFQVKWPTSWSPHHIAAKEMVPVVIALVVWGTHWKVLRRVGHVKCCLCPLIWHSKGPPVDPLPTFL